MIILLEIKTCVIGKVGTKMWGTKQEWVGEGYVVCWVLWSFVIFRVYFCCCYGGCLCQQLQVVVLIVMVG
jgi:hypothetical protein